MVPKLNNRIRRCYPGGAPKAFNITYDDGVEQDVRFVELLDRYGIPGTFNLNSVLMEQQFEWVHECGMRVKRLSPEAARHLYDRHEIASHTLTHPYMDQKTRDELMWELGEDKRQLEKWFDREVAGFAVPFSYYSDLIADCVQRCGFEYGRMSEPSKGYPFWQDPYRWRTGVFHLMPMLDAYVDGLFETDQELALCQIVGHSYDLDAAGLWDKMGSIIERIAGAEDVCPMTHIQIVRYARAMEKAQIYDDRIINDSDQVLWFRVDGTVVSVGAGQTVIL